VKIWDVTRGTETKQAKLPLCKSISSIAFSNSGNLIASSGTDLEISLLRVSGQGLQRTERCL